MKKSPEIAKILELAGKHRRFLITSHRDPDGDSIGSQLGLYYALVDIGKDVRVINQGAMPEKYHFLDSEKVISFENKPLPFKADVVFVLECPVLERIGFVRDLISPGAAIVNIDHHMDNGEYGLVNLIDTESCAVGELVYFIIQEGKFSITPLIAQSLYAALICDTGNFRFASTTARGMKIAAELVEFGANPKKIFDQIFAKSSPATLRLLGYTLTSLNIMADGKISAMTVSRDALKSTGARIEDSEGFVDFSLAVAGVIMGMLFKETAKGEVKVSVRSQNGIDAAAFAKLFDGGGHVNAAGFTLRGDLNQIEREVLEKADEFVHGK